MEYEKVLGDNLIEKIVYSAEIGQMDILKEKLTQLREKLHRRAEYMDAISTTVPFLSIGLIPLIAITVFNLNNLTFGLTVLGTGIFAFSWLLGGIFLGKRRYGSKKSWYSSPLIGEIDVLNSQYNTKVREATQILEEEEVQYNLIQELHSKAADLNSTSKVECEGKILVLAEMLMKHNFTYVLSELRDICGILGNDKNYQQFSTHPYFSVLKEKFSPKKIDIRNLL